MSLHLKCDGCHKEELVSDTVANTIQEVRYREGNGLTLVAELCSKCRLDIRNIFPSLEDQLQVPEFVRPVEEWDGIDRSDVT